MQLQLGHVLAGLAVRRRKPQRQSFVDRLLRLRIAQADQCRFAWLWRLAGEDFERYPRTFAADCERLAAEGVDDYFVLSPGGGWRSKCWPPERYGGLHRELARRTGLRGVVSYAPGERDLAEAVRRAAGAPEPAVVDIEVAQLMALVRRARFLVAGDSGPLHLAGAFGTPVIGLYGPTPPERNGPFNEADVVVRNARPEETTFHRGAEYSPSMLSVTVEQVVAAVERRLGTLA